MDAPKFIFIQPSLKENFLDAYPMVKTFASDEYLPNETFVVIADKNVTSVDNKGVLYVHPSNFGSYRENIFNLIGDIKVLGVSMAFSKFLTEVNKEKSYEQTSQYV